MFIINVPERSKGEKVQTTGNKTQITSLDRGLHIEIQLKLGGHEPLQNDVRTGTMNVVNVWMEGAWSALCSEFWTLCNASHQRDYLIHTFRKSEYQESRIEELGRPFLLSYSLKNVKLLLYLKEGYCSYFRCTEKSLWTVLTKCQHADCAITAANKRGETRFWRKITWHWYKAESIHHTCISSSSCWMLSKGCNKTVPGGNFKHCVYQPFREFCLQKGR